MEEQKTISLGDLTSSTITGEPKLQEVSSSEIRPISVKSDPLQEKMNDIFDKVDTAIERKKVDVDEKRDEIMTEIYEKQLENEELEDPNLDDDTESVIINKSEEENSPSLFVDTDDIDDLDEDEEASNDEQLDAIKSAIKDKIKPITNKIDIKSFTISKNPVSVLNALKSNISNKKTIDWVLPASGISVCMEALSGFEIQRLNPQSSGKSRFNTYKEIYGILYNHIIDENKPQTIEEWVKKINFFDINHLYFAAYKASFDGSNSIPYNCPHCNEIFMVDTPIDNMIKYKNDEIKNKVQNLLQKGTTNISNYEVELVQVSDEYVVGLREPSIYNVIFENVILDQEFTEKYNELLSILAYVDCIYYINMNDMSLQPIQLKEYPNNAVKTIKNRIVKYSQILQSLTSDQFYVFNSYIKTINDRHDDLVYILPEVTCKNEKCQKTIPEQEMNAESLLFTRHQLAGIANT